MQFEAELEGNGGGGGLIHAGVEVGDFAIFAIDNDLEGAAADFAVGLKFLVGQRQVDGDLGWLPAIGAKYGFQFFHEWSIKPSLIFGNPDISKPLFDKNFRPA